MFDYPKRKHPRLKQYDYSTPGAYFITICTDQRRALLSKVMQTNNARNTIELTESGRIAEEQLFELEKRYSCVSVKRFIIMPNHIHLIVVLKNEENCDRPSLITVIGSFKSITAKKCRQYLKEKKLFQTSFYEHVIRDRDEYADVEKYIVENPLKWREDELFSES